MILCSSTIIVEIPSKEMLEIACRLLVKLLSLWNNNCLYLKPLCSFISFQARFEVRSNWTVFSHGCSFKEGFKKYDTTARYLEIKVDWPHIVWILRKWWSLKRAGLCVLDQFPTGMSERQVDESGSWTLLPTHDFSHSGWATFLARCFPPSKISDPSLWVIRHMGYFIPIVLC